MHRGTVSKTKSPKPETDEQKARRLWDEKLARDAQRVLDKAKICRCGHSKADHRVREMIMFYSRPDNKLTTCYVNYKMNPEGIKCECPAFLLESVKG